MAFKFCPECGFKFDREYKFCPECGYKLDGAGSSNPDPLFDFSEDTAKYGDSGFGGFDEQLKKATASANEAAEELKLAIELYDAEKYDKVVPVFKKYAEKGNAEAQFYLAVCYGCGYGIPEDQDKWLYWMQKSADQGYAEAECRMGEHYEYDEEAYDYNKAVYWYQKAADHGDEFAKSFLESLKKQQQTKPSKPKPKPVYGKFASEKEELEWAIRADIDNAEEYKKAFSILKKYAEKGNAEAQYNLGLYYYNGNEDFGHGVAKDEGQAYCWFKKAADQGYEEAEDYLDPSAYFDEQLIKRLQKGAKK